MTDDPERPALEHLHDFDIRREGRSWSRDEIGWRYRALHEHPDAPGKLELVSGRLFHRNTRNG